MNKLSTYFLRTSCPDTHRIFFFHWLYSPLGPWPLIFSFMIILQTVRPHWTSDQLVARPLPKYRTTQTQNKHIHIPNIYALCGIRTHDPGFRKIEDNSCPIDHSATVTGPDIRYQCTVVIMTNCMVRSSGDLN
jgi:hypothetical protein